MEHAQNVFNTAEAWRKYASVGAISPDLLREHVLRAWVRSHDQGASPWVARAETLSPHGLERLLASEEDLLTAARPYLELLSAVAGEERHAAMLGTADGVVLDVRGDELSVSGPERVPEPGALLSEETAGSNGIGTPLAEGRYVEIVAAEHFIHGFHPFTCHGQPIDSADGERHGVISISVRQPEAAERLHEILVCASHGIAAEMARLRLERRLRAATATSEPRPEALERLAREVVRLGGQAPADDAGLFEATLTLARRANELATELTERARTWRELASQASGPLEPVDLDGEVGSLLHLLAGEAKERRIEIVRRRQLDRADGIADRRSLRRRLFRALLRAFGVAEGGGAVTVGLFSRRSDGVPVARVVATPPAEGEGAPLAASVPCVLDEQGGLRAS